MIDKLYEIFSKCTGVSTDTRTIREGNIFFALRGPSFDGNKFADRALDHGAMLAVVDDPNVVQDDRWFLVEDVLTALQQLANHHRNQLEIPVLGITGSNGKTTTKELTMAVLETEYQVLATRGNLNNHIGVPLTLLEIRPEHEFAIIEMGANKVGDIRELCEIADPDYGMITNIGKAHIEGFGGIEGVLRGKTELYDHLIKKEGRIFLNSLDEKLSNMKKRMKDPITYPASGDDYHGTLLGAEPFVSFQADNGEEVNTHLVGEYNFSNLMAALCIGKYFGANAEKANRAVAAYQPDNNRSQVIEKGGITVIMDAYNANPNSMAAAIRNLATFANKKRGVILGDMYELGTEAEHEHREIGRILSKAGFDQVFLTGELMEAAHDACPGSLYFSEKSDLHTHLKENPPEPMVLLIKGSRGMALETLLEALA